MKLHISEKSDRGVPKIIETYGREAFTFRENAIVATIPLHQILGISETAVENNLTFLKENGSVERVGSKKTGYWKVLE